MCMCHISVYFNVKLSVNVQVSVILVLGRFIEEAPGEPA